MLWNNPILQPNQTRHFIKGERVIATYRGKEHDGIVVQQKKNGIVVVEIYDEDEDAEMWIDARPENVKPVMSANPTAVERWQKIVRQSQTLPRKEFIAEYLVHLTRTKRYRDVVEGWQVKHDRGGGYVMLHPVYAPPGGHRFPDAASLFEYARRGPLIHYIREAEDLRHP